MNKLYLIILTILIIGCTDSIDDRKYRNSSYIFFKPKKGKSKWIEINANYNDFSTYPPGEFQYFFDNGKLFAKLLIKDHYNKNRQIDYYNDNKKVYNIKKYQNDSLIFDKYKDGYIKEYFSSKGIVISEGLIENGKKERKWKYFNEKNGILEVLQEWKNDKQYGLREEYFSNGQVANISYWNDGKSYGKIIHYYENGIIKDSFHVLNGLEHGKSFYYYNNGKLKAKFNYYKDQKIDSCFWYNEDGTLDKAKFYELDTLNYK